MAPPSTTEPQPSSDKRGFWGFWTTLPGVLTALTGLVAAAGTVLAIVVPGPGPSPAPPTPSPGPTPPITSETSRAEWVRAANKVCHTLQQDLTALGEPTGSQDTPIGWAENSRDRADLFTTAAEEFDAIPKPSADEERISRVVTNFSSVAAALQHLGADYETGDQTEWDRDSATLGRQGRAGNSMLRALGACK